MKQFFVDHIPSKSQQKQIHVHRYKVTHKCVNCNYCFIVIIQIGLDRW